MDPYRQMIRTTDRDGRVLSRWTLTQEQRELVARGGDIFLELMTFHQPLQPIRLAVGDALPVELAADFMPQAADE